jgi:hypothetical protein
MLSLRLLCANGGLIKTGLDLEVPSRMVVSSREEPREFCSGSEEVCVSGDQCFTTLFSTRGAVTMADLLFEHRVSVFG